MTPKMVTAISGAGALTSGGAGVYELWPPPTVGDALSGILLVLVAMLFLPMGLYVSGVTAVIVEIASSKLPPDQKRDELKKCVDPLFVVFDRFTGFLRAFITMRRKNDDTGKRSDRGGDYDG
jgi:hypothetical protein